MNKLLAHIKIMRPLNLTIGAFAVLISASILNQIDQISVWLIALLVVVCYNAAANVINDYFDQDTDKINRPHRPLITGVVKPRNALILSIVIFALGTVLALSLTASAAFIAIAIALPLMIFYSILIKGLPLVGNVVIAAILGLTFLFAGAAMQNMQAMIIPALLAFGLTIVREIIKDIGDIEGDKKAGLNTLPIVTSVKTAWIIAIMFAILIGIGAVFPYLHSVYNKWYIILVIFGVEIPLIITVFSAMKFPTINNAIRSARLLKFSTIAGVFAVWLGSI